MAILKQMLASRMAAALGTKLYAMEKAIHWRYIPRRIPRPYVSLLPGNPHFCELGVAGAAARFTGLSVGEAKAGSAHSASKVRRSGGGGRRPAGNVPCGYRRIYGIFFSFPFSDASAREKCGLSPAGEKGLIPVLRTVIIATAVQGN